METILAKALGQDAAQLAAAEKRDLLARLLAQLAHEVRNPLSSLDVHLQLLEEDLGGLTPPWREKLSPRLEVLRGELHRLENIVERFLRLTGPSALDLEPLEIHKIVQHVCNVLRPEAAARRVQIVTRLPEPLPSVTADSIRLTQALLNLLINALQAVEPGGRIEVGTAEPDPGGRIAIFVQDNGPGIPPGQETAIFDPYYTTKSEGRGLGLWIAQQIAVAHGGSLRAENAAGGGARFTLTLPLERE